LTAQDAVSVQVSWDAGWRASVNGVAFPTGKDALGFLVLEPDCAGKCAIDLVYDGGMQGKIADLLCALGFVACGYMIYLGLKRSRGSARLA
jgi:hypothetical protein